MKKKVRIYLVSLLISLIMSNYCYSLSQPKESYQTLKESINALDVTRTKSLRSLSNLNQYHEPSLHQEYSVFFEYLSYRIEKYCTQISELYGDR